MFASIYFIVRLDKKVTKDPLTNNADKNKPNAQDEFEKIMRIEPIEVGLSAKLSKALVTDSADFSERITNLRRQFALDFGFILPKVHLAVKPDLHENNYSLFIQGSQVGAGELQVHGRVKPYPNSNSRKYLRSILELHALSLMASKPKIQPMGYRRCGLKKTCVNMREILAIHW